MNSFVFPFFFSFGKGDSVDSTITVELPDEKAKRLIQSAKEGGRFRLDEDSEIQDIYDDVLFAIQNGEKAALQANPTPVANALSWRKGYDPEKPITKRQIANYVNKLDIGINYPEELQGLKRTVRRNVKQTICDSVVTEQENAKALLQDPEYRDKILYVDDRKTLFYVPQKYSGAFTIPSAVQKIEDRAFQARDKITEIVIEEGLLEIPDWAFEGCKSLERISIPGSVQKIGFNAFTKCENLKTVQLSEGLTQLDSTAFRLCSNLTSLCFPSTLKSVSAYITTCWNSLRDLSFLGMETEITDIDRDLWARITMHVFPGSRAEATAKRYHIRHSLLKK